MDSVVNENYKRTTRHYYFLINAIVVEPHLNKKLLLSKKLKYSNKDYELNRHNYIGSILFNIMQKNRVKRFRPIS